MMKRGLPKPGPGAGDLFAIVQIAVPTVLSERERSLMKEMASNSTFNPRGHFEQELKHGN
jgi:curved DNA-binding protein